MTMIRKERLIDAYLDAKEEIIRRGFGEEIDWQLSLEFDSVCESQFLMELAWVVLNAGMKETVVRGRFGGVSTAFLHWESASAIARNAETCREHAYREFAHGGKIDAITNAAVRIASCGFGTVKADVEAGGPAYLESFDFIGSITSLHLAKNLGLDVVKPDRHLCRVAQAAGYSSPADMCEAIALDTGDRLAIVDLVIWRYATLTKGYCEKFAAAQ